MEINDTTAKAEISGSSKATRLLFQRLVETDDSELKPGLVANLILAVFDDFYSELCHYPTLAKKAFEAMDPQGSIRISRERLGLYSQYVSMYGPRIKAGFPDLADKLQLWDTIEDQFDSLIVARYEADIAYAFMHSIRRNISHVIWQPVAYSFPADGKNRGLSSAQAHQRFPVNGTISTTLIVSALQLPRFKVPYRDCYGDAASVSERLSQLDGQGEISLDDIVAVEFIEAAFFRDLTAFLVGRLETRDGQYLPIALALLNEKDGVYVDAVLFETSDVHNLFSSTLANFHVANDLYYQNCVFLSSIMPMRPIGLHYSTIGFNHVGKVAILDEIKQQLSDSGQRFASSPGFDGTVAIGFTFDNCSYHLKVIRDKPTKSYKWGEFAGVTAVLDKYRVVHEINRTGSMVDNVMYFNLELDPAMFSQELLDDLLENCSGSVQREPDCVLFRSLIVQLKIVPLPVYFETASQGETEQAVRNLGHCIKNNIAANIFNKDLDARNYGVGRYSKVFLFDYDAVERFTDIALASNLDMEDGEEDIPDWFFSDDFVFLPEELESGLQIEDRSVRRLFREIHADLLTLDYWSDAQDKLKRGDVIGLKSYPENRKLGSVADT